MIYETKCASFATSLQERLSRESRKVYQVDITDSN